MTGSLTAAGAAVGSGGLGLLALGVATSAPTLAAVGAAGLVALVSGGLAVGVRPRLRVRRAASHDAVEAGAEVQVRVEVRNTGRWLPVSGQLAEPVSRRGTSTTDDVPVRLPIIAPRSVRTVSYTVPARHRGVITLGPLRLDNTDPLALARRRADVGERIDVIVHPRIYTAELDLAGASRSIEGVDRDGAPTGSVAFHSLRSYVPGDDPRAIHWRSSARRGELVVRQNVDVVLPRVTVLLDSRARSYQASRGEAESSFESAISVAASLAHAAVERQVSLQLATTAGAVLTIDGPGDLCLALDLLARLEGDTGLGVAEVSSALQVQPGAGLVVLTGSRAGFITGQAADADAGAVSALARRHQRAMVLEFDAPEFDAPEFDAPEFDAPELDPAELDPAELNAPQFDAPVPGRDRVGSGPAARLGSTSLLRCADAPSALRRLSTWGLW